MGEELNQQCKNWVEDTPENAEKEFKKMREAGYEWDAEKKELKTLKE